MSGAAAAATGRLQFTKMHGAGNDFVVVDGRDSAWRAQLGQPAAIARLCDRHRGVGCDQLMVLEHADAADAAFGYRIFNADASPARQCGNGVRCLAAWIERAGLARAPFRLDSPAGPVAVRRDRDGALSVALSEPRFAPADVPYTGAAGEGELSLGQQTVRFSVASLGNPHAVVQVDDVASAPVAAVGAALQQDPRFPDRCNVGFVQLLDRRHARLRVYERGAGETLACGSGACAAAAVLIRAGLADAPLSLALPGGTLVVDWAGSGHPAWLSGPVAFVFDGEWMP
jgi:diaminopimelate epimerase